MGPGVLLRLSLDLLGIGLFEESSQLRAELGEMIKQLCIGKIVRGRNAWVLIDCSYPGMENFVPMGEYKVAKTCDCSNLRPALTVTSDERSLLILFRRSIPPQPWAKVTMPQKNSKPKECNLRFASSSKTADVMCAILMA